MWGLVFFWFITVESNLKVCVVKIIIELPLSVFALGYDSKEIRKCCQFDIEIMEISLKLVLLIQYVIYMA